MNVVRGATRLSAHPAPFRSRCVIASAGCGTPRRWRPLSASIHLFKYLVHSFRWRGVGWRAMFESTPLVVGGGGNAGCRLSACATCPNGCTAGAPAPESNVYKSFYGRWRTIRASDRIVAFGVGQTATASEIKRTRNFMNHITAQQSLVAQSGMSINSATIDASVMRTILCPPNRVHMFPSTCRFQIPPTHLAYRSFRSMSSSGCKRFSVSRRCLAAIARTTPSTCFAAITDEFSAKGDLSHTHQHRQEECA